MLLYFIIVICLEICRTVKQFIIIIIIIINVFMYKDHRAYTI